MIARATRPYLHSCYNACSLVHRIPYAAGQQVFWDCHLHDYNDHAPPHLHAEYGEHEAVYLIETLEIMRGGLPRRAHGMVMEWASLYRQELRHNWGRASSMRPLHTIQPLE